MDPGNVERLRKDYHDLPDMKLAELHAEGPTAYASPEVWELLDQEFKRRGSRAAQIQVDVTETRRQDAEQAAIEATVERRRARSDQRIGSMLIDVVFLILVFALVGLLLKDVDTPLADTILRLTLAVFILYHPICEFTTQRTLGKRLFGLKVVTTTGARPSLGDILTRHLARLLMLLTAGLLFGLVWYFAFGTFWVDDVFSKTRVVNVSKAAPLTS